MSLSWKALVAGAGTTAGALVLAATALTGAVGAQSPSPSPAPAATPAPAASPAASPAAAQGGQPGTPPNRIYGTAQLNGQPAPSGTTITALVGTATCGTAQVSGTGTYVIDVASSASQPGCGTDGATVAFTVGTARASQTTQWRQGAFTELNLTAQTATPTPSPRPATATPSPRPATATPAPRTPTPRPSPTATPPRPSPTAQPSAAPQRPVAPAAPAAQRPAAPPAALPRTGTGLQADNGATAGWAFGGLALAAIALGATGFVTYRRSR